MMEVFSPPLGKKVGEKRSADSFGYEQVQKGLRILRDNSLQSTFQ
jgi:hypothetical protein